MAAFSTDVICQPLLTLPFTIGRRERECGRARERELARERERGREREREELRGDH